MSDKYMNIELLVKKMSDDNDHCSLTDFEKVAVNTGDTVQQLFVKTAIYFAKAFMAEEIDFDCADGALNDLFSIMITHSHKTDEDFVDSIAFAIYDAFDAGEYSPLKDEDPVKTRTIPQLQYIFEELDKNGFVV